MWQHGIDVILKRQIFVLACVFLATILEGNIQTPMFYRLDGVAVFDRSGWSVSNAGDVNGDGFDDVIVGASDADPNGDRSGAVVELFDDRSDRVTG